MKNLLDRRTFLAGAAICAATAGTAYGKRGRGRGGDHERARRALEEGEVRPLADILEEMRRRFGGEVIEVELDDDDDRYVYELTIVTPSGRLLEIVVDAATGAVLEIDEE